MIGEGRKEKGLKKTKKNMKNEKKKKKNICLPYCFIR